MNFLLLVDIKDLNFSKIDHAILPKHELMNCINFLVLPATPSSGISEEELARLEAKIEELEDKVMDLDFKRSDLEQDNKNMAEAKKVRM